MVNKRENDAQLQLQLKQAEIQLKQAENGNMLIKEGIPTLKEYLAKNADKEKHIFSWVNGVYLTLFGLIIIGTIYLTSIKVVSSDAFAFVMGTMVGAVLSYVKDVFGK